jgi:hypothetical protein
MDMNDLILPVTALILVWKIVRQATGRTRKVESAPPKKVAMVVLIASFVATAIAVGALITLPWRMAWVPIAIVLASQEFRSWILRRNWHPRQQHPLKITS